MHIYYQLYKTHTCVWGTEWGTWIPFEMDLCESLPMPTRTADGTCDRIAPATTDPGFTVPPYVVTGTTVLCEERPGADILPPPGEPAVFEDRTVAEGLRFIQLLLDIGTILWLMILVLLK